MNTSQLWPMLTLALIPAVQALPLDTDTPSDLIYYGQDQPFVHPAPPTLQAIPPRPYIDTAPRDFIVIPDRHVFYDSRLPTVADATVRVFIRSYDPERRIYVNDEVLDPTCLLACLSRQGQNPSLP